MEYLSEKADFIEQQTNELFTLFSGANVCDFFVRMSLNTLRSCKQVSHAIKVSLFRLTADFIHLHSESIC